MITKRTSAGFLLLATLLLNGGCSSILPEKAIRHPIKTDYSVHDPGFSHSMSQLLSAQLVPGNQVVELVNGQEIFPAMLEAIRGAQKSVTLESYIWSSGNVSTQFVTALSDRARAGVKVHVMLDSLGSLKLGKWDHEELSKAGVKLLKYNPPLPFKIFRVNHRTHRKLMVVDGRIGFTGGVCFSDAWQGNAEPDHWRDTHVRVEGPVVGQMQGVFMDNWLQMRSQVLHGEDYFPEIPARGSTTAQYFESGPREGAESARLAYLLSIAAARKNIRLAHSYFVPNDLLIDALLDARKRGVHIEVIVPDKIDHFAVRKAARTRWNELLAAGVVFYQYGPAFYHCKIMVVDDVWSTIGSVNVDERSFRINDEANLNVLDREFAAALIRSFEKDKSQSRQLTASDLKRRNFFSKTFDHFVALFQSQL